MIDRERLTCIGKVTQAHGVKGDLKVAPLTDTPAYYENTREVILETGQGLRDFKKAFGATEPATDSFQLYRYLLHADFKYRNLFRVFVQGAVIHDENRDLGGSL